MTPFDVGWDFLVKFNHEFTGREALEKLAKEPRRRTPVTLEWNAEDVERVFATRLCPSEEPCEDISVQSDAFWNVKAEGEGFIDPQYARVGTELEILWGTPGTRQMKIRAKVARYPYNDDYIRNQDKDVETIPRVKRQ